MIYWTLSLARLVIEMLLALEPCDSFATKFLIVPNVPSVFPSVFRKDLFSNKFPSSDLSKSCQRSFPGEGSALCRPSSTVLHQRRKISSHSRQQRHRRYLPIHRRFENDSDRDFCSTREREFVDHYQIFQQVEEEYAEIQARYNGGSRSLEDKNKEKNLFFFKNTFNVESMLKLISPRTYGRQELLIDENLNQPPTLGDLNQGPGKVQDTYWKEPIFRLCVVATSYLSFPLWCLVFEKFVTVDPERFNTMVRQIAPNVGVLYATILALTLEVLYSRVTRIQENAAIEAMLLSQITRNLLSLFVNESEWAIEACQIVANQIVIMFSRTRGTELLSIMRADTYSSILSLVDDYHYLHGRSRKFTASHESITRKLRSELCHIMEVRAQRLSDEASSLPPTHFTLITSLSFVSIVAYVTASLAVVDDAGSPPQEASLLFAGLFSLYYLFFNFCRDLNEPFKGVYQIKRSNAVSHLMQTKWLIVSELGDSVTFDTDCGNVSE